MMPPGLAYFQHIADTLHAPVGRWRSGCRASVKKSTCAVNTPGRGPIYRRPKEALDLLGCHVATATIPLQNLHPCAVTRKIVNGRKVPSAMGFSRT